MANFFGHTPTPFLFCKGVPPLRGRDTLSKRKQPASLWGQANRLRTTTKGANNRVRATYANVRWCARWFVRVWGVGAFWLVCCGLSACNPPWYLIPRKKGYTPLNHPDNLPAYKKTKADCLSGRRCLYRCRLPFRQTLFVSQPSADPRGARTRAFAHGRRAARMRGVGGALAAHGRDYGMHTSQRPLSPPNLVPASTHRMSPGQQNPKS